MNEWTIVGIVIGVVVGFLLRAWIEHRRAFKRMPEYIRRVETDAMYEAQKQYEVKKVNAVKGAGG